MPRLLKKQAMESTTWRLAARKSKRFDSLHKKSRPLVRTAFFVSCQRGRSEADLEAHVEAVVLLAAVAEAAAVADPAADGRGQLGRQPRLAVPQLLSGDNRIGERATQRVQACVISLGSALLSWFQASSAYGVRSVVRPATGPARASRACDAAPCASGHRTTSRWCRCHFRGSR